MHGGVIMVVSLLFCGLTYCIGDLEFFLNHSPPFFLSSEYISGGNLRQVLKDKVRQNQIGHLWVHFSLFLKASLLVKSLLWISVFIHIEIRTNYRSKNFTRRITLKERLSGTRKWAILKNWRHQALKIFKRKGNTVELG